MVSTFIEVSGLPKLLIPFGLGLKQHNWYPTDARRSSSDRLPYYAGQVKCIYIDPPYNTGNEGWAYNDNVNSPMMQIGRAHV